jgi:hypothetical protein
VEVFQRGSERAGDGEQPAAAATTQEGRLSSKDALLVRRELSVDPTSSAASTTPTVARSCHTPLQCYLREEVKSQRGISRSQRFSTCTIVTKQIQTVSSSRNLKRPAYNTGTRRQMPESEGKVNKPRPPASSPWKSSPNPIQPGRRIWGGEKDSPQSPQSRTV